MARKVWWTIGMILFLLSSLSLLVSMALNLLYKGKFDAPPDARIMIVVIGIGFMILAHTAPRNQGE